MKQRQHIITRIIIMITIQGAQWTDSDRELERNSQHCLYEWDMQNSRLLQIIWQPRVVPYIDWNCGQQSQRCSRIVSISESVEAKENKMCNKHCKGYTINFRVVTCYMSRFINSYEPQISLNPEMNRLQESLVNGKTYRLPRDTSSEQIRGINKTR